MIQHAVELQFGVDRAANLGVRDQSEIIREHQRGTRRYQPRRRPCRWTEDRGPNVTFHLALPPLSLILGRSTIATNAPRKQPNAQPRDGVGAPPGAQAGSGSLLLVRRPPDQHLALADMVGRPDDAFLLHLLDQLGGAVVADVQMALDEAACSPCPRAPPRPPPGRTARSRRRSRRRWPDSVAPPSSSCGSVTSST